MIFFYLYFALNEIFLKDEGTVNYFDLLHGLKIRLNYLRSCKYFLKAWFPIFLNDRLPSETTAKETVS